MDLIFNKLNALATLASVHCPHQVFAILLRVFHAMANTSDLVVRGSHTPERFKPHYTTHLVV